ncbi:MAG: hypothetical protein IT530_21700 [Burkholderiales bacterium]|nr:hypothetical protein [Burkholderiales bacterium]
MVHEHGVVPTDDRVQDEMRLLSTTIDGPDDAGELFTDMVRRGYTDGLPVIPPTEKAVRAMIEGSGLSPQDEVAVMPPVQGAATVEKLAINSVMAGCLPEYFPVVVAAARAVMQPQFNLLTVQCTTSAAGPVLMLNGPIRRQIGVNCGRGCMGPGNRANATIGRAMRLILMNIGGATVGDVDKAVHGYPGKYSFCFGELEEESPWEPFHVQQGYDATDSTVTVVAGQCCQSMMALYLAPEAMIDTIADGMAVYGQGYLRGVGGPVVVVTPGHARIFEQAGWSKKDVRQALFEAIRIPLSRRPEGRSTHQVIFNDWDRSRSIELCETPDDIILLVAGGEEPYQVTYICSFSNITKAMERI